MKKIIMVLILSFALMLQIAAEEPALYTTEEFGAERVLDTLPSEIRSLLPENAFSARNFSETFSAEYFLNLCTELIRNSLSPALKMLSVTMGLVILSSALSALRGLLKSDSLTRLFEYIAGLCILLALYTNTAGLYTQAAAYLKQLSRTVGAMVPVMIAVGTAGGNLSASTVSASGMMLGLSIVETLAAKGLYPILELCFGLNAASGIGGGLKLGGITKMVRNLFTWMLGLTSAAISAIMSFQNTIASRADSLSMRAVKFAASNTVPVVGGLAGDAMTAVAGSLSLVRGTVGMVGIIIIAVLTLPVILQLLLSRLGIVLSQTAADILGLEREKDLLGEVHGLLGSLTAVCVIAAMMFVYALAVFAKTASAL